MREGATRRRRIALLVGVAIGAAALGIAAYAAHALRSFELSTVDTRFSIRGADRPPSDVVIVAIDEATLNGLKTNFPFRRVYDARVIDRLRSAGARAIGFDVEFVHPTDDADDNALIDAAARARGIVLGTSEVNVQGQTEVFGGEAVLGSIGARAGNTAVRFDSDGVLRRVAYSLQGLKTFAVVLAEQATRRAVPVTEFGGGSVPVDFAGPPGTIRSVSFLRVLNNQVPASVFRGKVVVVGVTAPAYQDLHDTAVSGGHPMTGAEYQANALTTVLNGNPLGDASGALNLILIVLLGLAVPLASLRLRPILTLAIGVGLGSLYAVVTQLSFDGGTMIAVAYPLLALALGTTGSIVADLLLETRERRTLETTLAAGTSIAEFFICYRRDQSGWPARILRDELAARFGESSVFMDLESIDAGQEFPGRIDDAIRGCAAVLVLIGPGWLDARESDGSRRIDDPDDWVRLEIEAGLGRDDAAVVPVLLDGATMPPVEQLPHSIRPLARRNAVELSADHWSNAIDGLVESVKRGRFRDFLGRSAQRAEPSARG
jgi:CHASE2 domain-containing sensor protein